MFRPWWAIFRENNIDTLRVRGTCQTEDEAQGTFAHNYISATILYQYYSP
jgi:hypothetical protein